MDNFKVNICQVKTTSSFEKSCTLYMRGTNSHFPGFTASFRLPKKFTTLLSLLCIYIFQISYEMQYFGNLNFKSDNVIVYKIILQTAEVI
jgi:hypothetical protein